MSCCGSISWGLICSSDGSLKFHPQACWAQLYLLPGLEGALTNICVLGMCRFWKHGLSVWGAPTDYEGTASDTKQAQQPRDTTCSDANGSSHATVIPGLITILPPPPCAETKGNNRRMCKFSLMKPFIVESRWQALYINDPSFRSR